MYTQKAHLSGSWRAGFLITITPELDEIALPVGAHSNESKVETTAVQTKSTIMMKDMNTAQKIVVFTDSLSLLQSVNFKER